MDDFKDERFKGIIKDPRFKKISSQHGKTKADKRIHGMFSDKRFDLGCKVDKRGLPLNHKIPKDHQKFYQQDEGESESCTEDEDSARDNEGSGSVDLSSGIKAERDLSGNDELEKDVDEESEDDAENVPNSSLKKIPPVDEEGSTSTDTEISDEEQEEEIDHHWQELDADAPRAANITRRLAICNMDWDRLRAEDFLVVFNSFKPPDGVIHSLKIYPSEFGLERMKKEELHGPAELINNKLDSAEVKATNDTQDSRFHQEKLRQYQINRLKYYFAVVDCDSPRTADALYNELNGMEFESSGCILDLRFIPDDMIFDQEPVSVTSSISCPEDYKPLHFVTSALNQIKVDLTWDETDPRRNEVLEKAFTDPESIEKDLKEYLASPSESEDEAEELEDSTNAKKLSCEEAITKYRTLLQALEEKEKNEANEEIDMEITWDSGLKEKTEKLVKEKTLKETLTPFEEKLHKRKELKKMKKEMKATHNKDDDGISSSEEYGSGDFTDDEFQEKVRDTSRGSKKNKVKSESNCEKDEKKLAELALLVAEPDEKDSSDSDGMSGEKKRKKRKKKQKGNEEAQESLEEYTDDPRFAAMYTSHLYHVDPAEQKFREKKETQVFIKATQRKKYGNSDSTVTPSGTTKKETDFIEGSKGKGKKSVKVQALKEKLTSFCRELDKKKEPINSEKQNQGLQKEGHFSVMGESLSDSLSEAACSKQRKRVQKVKKRKIDEASHEGDMSTANGKMLHSTASSYLEENDDPGILIFSRDSRKKQASTFSSDPSHSTNSVRKKLKKNHVS